MLVLPGRRPHVSVTRAAPLPERYFVDGPPRSVGGGGNPGGVRVLLANPRWERRLLRFLELSGVGRVMDDGADEGGARAGKLDGWIIWEAEERMEREGMG